MSLQKKHLTVAALLILAGFLLLYVIQGRWALFWNDIFVVIIGIFLFNHFFKTLNQNLWSYGAFLTIMILHVAYLYPYTFLVPWDVYMHFLSGLSLGIIVYRLFLKEKWSSLKKILIILLVVMGVGAVHEMIEWAGYAVLGEGEGWLLHGEGDEGEWRDTITDLFFNFLGVLTFLLIHQTFKRRKK